MFGPDATSAIISPLLEFCPIVLFNFYRGLERGDSQSTTHQRCFPNLAPFILHPRVPRCFHCFATFQTAYRNLLTFFSPTSDFLVHPFLHLIRDESYSPLATSSKSPNQNHVIAMWVSWVGSLSQLYISHWVDLVQKSPILCTCGANCSFSLHGCGHLPLRGSYSLLSQEENTFPLKPYIMKTFLYFSFFQRKFLSPQTLGWHRESIGNVFQ